jgi:hypothetical protein
MYRFWHQAARQSGVGLSSVQQGNRERDVALNQVEAYP